MNVSCETATTKRGYNHVVRLCTYNIHAGKSEAGTESVDAIVDTLRDVDADVILLQEVDRYLARSGYRDLARQIAARLGKNHYFYGRLRFGWAAFGNAILTAEPVASVDRLPLPARGGEVRGAIRVTLESGLFLWCTHLGLRSDWRATQLAALSSAVNATPGPLVVGGDFNAALDEQEIREFRASAGLKVAEIAELTYPTSAPTARIDFLFNRGLIPTDSGTIAAPGSDHCLVWTDFDLPTTGPA
jgi:endonuclease/exonuclease/phosphatase family metal-dependent hydrolase